MAEAEMMCLRLERKLFIRGTQGFFLCPENKDFAPRRTIREFNELAGAEFRRE
jgi:hypothetical protein